MLTYDLTNAKGPLYKAIYEYIKADIHSGKLQSNTKMPSKRAFAKNLGVSIITVENAYEQLIGEGYLYALPKKGYYIADMTGMQFFTSVGIVEKNIRVPGEANDELFDFSSNRMDVENFPFSVWAKLMRETISLEEKELLKVSPSGGVMQLRKAIADYLHSFRGVLVDPNQIIVGAGTEYLYGLLIKLLGADKTYCVENPGYKKVAQIYKSSGVAYRLAALDEQGMDVEELKNSGADIAHVSPTHHFPTGITMPVSRRYELLSWAQEASHYIIEDDYDSEFRFGGNPIPPLFSLDRAGKVIYMNTFSKSLASTIRISYMVLPEELANAFYEKLYFYSCTVSTFEQYTLAKFIGRGYFEKHINRMRLYYKRKRAKVLQIIKSHFDESECSIIENDSGLHFLLEFHTSMPDEKAKELLLEKGIRIQAITDFEMGEKIEDKHQFILDYSKIDAEGLENVVDELRSIIE